MTSAAHRGNLARAAALALVAPAAAAVAAGCACSDTPAFVADFEGCSGTCGWAIAGPGPASIVSTILPSEHGLSIGSAAAKTSTTATYTFSSPIGIDATYELSLVADCPAGLGVTLSIVTPGASEQPLPVPLALDETPTSSSSLPDYTGVTYLPMTGPVTLPMGKSTAQVRAIAVEGLPGGTCVFDLVELTPGTTCSS
jgi:hypothetical protein